MLKSIKLETIQEIALKAGKVAMSVYQKDFAIYEKEGYTIRSLRSSV